MVSHQHRLLVGANGWVHASWRDRFYPEDLPDDWQLTYYSNEFRVVLLPTHYWDIAGEGPSQWLDACDGDFAFVVEVPAELIQRALHDPVGREDLVVWSNRCQTLGPQCLGLLVEVRDEVDAGALEPLLADLSEAFNVCVEIVGAGARDALWRLAQNLQLGLVWDGQGESPRFGWGELAVTRLRRAPADLRGLRRVVEHACELTATPRTAVLLVDIEPPDIEVMRQAEVIANLL